mmetsp:Transcript_40354/g.114237  ORF Transcript_40354/g.114237 Transcript_40354/m.114237 type:complete len:277 (-) Transcript_40354:407-1237(-)|eukprot:CAMPEP_0117677038 /NCGR_PEP_ID=MMETSP0804-20121206/16530_1 /TAXON_ID=1074897 /ORGANISM="Tetraselmis astigmatica, Strain CCMP880" /LENGTH=276 /DNA_ID=CAMNT_0005486291 /DNA_START=122 /DNA_END=952 /DNA_ORIENTATION=+
MVQLHVKKSDQERFLYNTTVEATVRDAVREVVEIHNLRMRVHRLKLEGEELAKYGPAKPIDKQGIDEYQEEPVERGPHYNQDPTGRRTGNACDANVQKVLMKTLEDAEKTASKDQADNKVCLTKKMLDDAMDEIRGAVMICYPMGLPAWDPVRTALEANEDLSGTSHANDDLEPDKSQLWFAGKQMMPDKLLKDFVGRHEKTKAVVRLQKAGGGAPSREPVVDPETQKAMVAHYHKKQEEMKKLEEDMDDAYTHSTWASQGSLKAHFSGTSNIRIR